MSAPRAVRPSFRHLVGRATLATRWDWTRRDWFAASTIPLIFAVGFGSSALSNGAPEAVLVADTAIRLLLMGVLVVAYAPLLADHWQGFTAALWRGIGLVLVGGILLQVAIGVTRAIVPAPDSAPTATLPYDATTATSGQFALLLVFSLGPLATAFIEDTVFRHTLLARIPAWGSRTFAVMLVIGNSIAFGAVHYYNFGSLLGTVPYMVAGLCLNLVYLWTRNIWHVLLIHLVNNLLLTTVALLVVYLLRDAVG